MAAHKDFVKVVQRLSKSRDSVFWIKRNTLYFKYLTDMWVSQWTHLSQVEKDMLILLAGISMSVSSWKTVGSMLGAMLFVALHPFSDPKTVAEEWGAAQREFASAVRDGVELDDPELQDAKSRAIYDAVKSGAVARLSTREEIQAWIDGLSRDKN